MAKEINLQIQNVGHSFGKTEVLRSISGELFPGIHSIIGPSGCGKSTLFEIISGIRKPTSGQVLAGTPLAPVKLGKIGVVQQNYPLFDHRTVWKNLLIAARLCKSCPGPDNCHGCKKQKEQEVADILGRFGLWERRDYYPDQLSGGQRQRVAIAQQLMSAEHFLLLDEPFSGLDVNMTKEVSKMLVEIAKQDPDNTIIIVSHDISATAAISDTLWILGRDQNPDSSAIPGAYIKHRFDLVSMGLDYEQSSHENPIFTDLIHQIRNLFPTL